jgi:hypothetical protein
VPLSTAFSLIEEQFKVLEKNYTSHIPAFSRFTSRTLTARNADFVFIEHG